MSGGGRPVQPGKDKVKKAKMASESDDDRFHAIRTHATMPYSGPGRSPTSQHLHLESKHLPKPMAAPASPFASYQPSLFDFAPSIPFAA